MHHVADASMGGVQSSKMTGSVFMLTYGIAMIWLA
jgi:hypothetical protein